MPVMFSTSLNYWIDNRLIIFSAFPSWMQRASQLVTPYRWSLALHPEPRIEILGLVESGRNHELQSQLVNDIDWMVVRIGPFKRDKEWGKRQVQTGKTISSMVSAFTKDIRVIPLHLKLSIFESQKELAIPQDNSSVQGTFVFVGLITASILVGDVEANRS
ncbi:hypothetical protein C8J55DRAFT_489641 [Lentinula edodes]|uniref:Uncharacterized protein n=1 Tax=Lentinula lateritia TaxID=40482 RepID=A0A9W9ABC8_9AGAR|nr:hypothetical protein C8J55DRAFT_489641 [Lentinula edodes]